MRYAAPSVAGLAALFLATATPPGVPSQVEVAASVIPSVQRIVTAGGYGSGSVISCTPNKDGSFTVLFLTAKHVIVDHEGNAVDTVTVLGYDAKVLAMHDDRDIAIVEAKMDFMLPTIPGIRMEPLSPGEEVFGFGYSLSRQMWVTNGIASSDDRAGFAAPGDSGGATCDKYGYLVGVTVAIDRHGYSDLAWHHTYLEPTHNMIDWLRGYADIDGLLR